MVVGVEGGWGVVGIRREMLRLGEGAGKALYAQV